MKLEGVKPSSNVEDHTGRSDLMRAADTFFTKLNPVYAARKIRGSLIEGGVIAPKRTIRLGMPKSGGK